MATIDTIADRSTGTAIAGKAYFETSTNKFIVFNGSAWIELDSDGVGAVFENRWGASFDGSNDFMTVPDDASLNVSSGFTVSAWIYLNSLGVFQGIVSKRDGSSTNYQFYIRNGNVLSYYNGSNLYNDTTTLSSGVWTHVAVSATSNSSASFYINGSLSSTHSIGAITSSTSDVYIGQVTGVSHFNGSMDDVAIFDTALDQTAITALYGAAPNAGIPSEVTGAIGYWRMGDDSNDTATSGGSIATITDSSGNGNDAVQATASKQPTFKAHALSTASLSFDASGDYLEKTFSSAPCAGAYTIGFWFNTSVNNSYLSLFENSDSLGNYNGGFRVYRFSDGSIRLATANSTGAWAHEAIAHSTSLNTWHYVVITRSAHGVSPEIYLDGVLPSGNTYGTPQTDVISATKLRIGCNQTAYSLTGYMDEVSFFNSELTGSDLTAYLSAARGTHLINDLSLSPTAYYRMGEDDGLTDGQTGISQITDASGNGNHATQATAANQPTASVGPVIYV